ncbi:hypothetical protein [Pengzhenrongella frigida]|uniref:Peptidase M23 n=1 Tax=Pengzhenrongella frigida TaxID=1259133 RepID=A0A4Q5MZK2_9MICO|nr:hypothetical protein EUA98_09700 [Cellulomonas sp. HLT2-17]
MDGIAAISGRIAAIQHTLAALSATAPVATAPATTGAASSGAGTFSAVLATEVAGQAGAAAPVAVGSYRPEQVANAAAIVRAGRAMGLSVRDQTIGVMTALGESSLTVADHGDVAGPDSRGLFQQRANGAWGSMADRMDPTVSATNFFTALTAVEGRDGMAPTLVAHAVQRNADPQHYAKYWDDAVALVGRLSAVA